MTDVHVRPRAGRSRAAELLPTTAAAILILVLAAVLGIGSFDRPAARAGAAANAPAVIQQASDLADEPRILFRLSGGSATVTLDDTATARELAGLLPLQLTLRDPMGQAKVARLPVLLTTAGEDRVVDPETAGLYYWPPTGDVAVFHDDLGRTVPAPGMVRLGTVTTGLQLIASAGNRSTVVIERA